MRDSRGGNPTFVLYGMPASLYTGKARAYLRKQRIAFEERTPGDPRFRDEVLPAVGRWIIPVLQTPDGAFIQDSADIIDAIEARGLARMPALPDRPPLRVIARLFELFGGEGLLRPAMHYRWNFDDANLAFLRADFSASLAPPGTPAAQAVAVFERSSAAMRKAAVAFGVTPDTHTRVQASYREFLDLFDAHLQVFPYLLGETPTRGDYGLFGPLHAHLARDPYPSMLMKQHAPRVWRWTERMNGAQQDAGEYRLGATPLATDSLFPPTLLALLRYVAEEYGGELRAHVRFAREWLEARPHIPAGRNGLDKPGARAIGMAAFPWRGVSIKTAVMPYRFYLLQKVQAEIVGLEQAERRTLMEVLSNAGLGDIPDLTLPRSVLRLDHLEVWGAPT